MAKKSCLIPEVVYQRYQYLPTQMQGDLVQCPWRGRNWLAASPIRVADCPCECTRQYRKGTSTFPGVPTRRDGISRCNVTRGSTTRYLVCSSLRESQPRHTTAASLRQNYLVRISYIQQHPCSRLRLCVIIVSFIVNFPFTMDFHASLPGGISSGLPAQSQLGRCIIKHNGAYIHTTYACMYMQVWSVRYPTESKDSICAYRQLSTRQRLECLLQYMQYIY